MKFFEKLLKGIEKAFSSTNSWGHVMWYITGVPPVIIVEETRKHLESQENQ